MFKQNRGAPGVLAGFVLILSMATASALAIECTTPKPYAGQRSEFRISGVAEAANPYDPDDIAVDVRFSPPAGETLTLPAFWYQPYSRVLRDGKEMLVQDGAAEWRVRYTPLEPGEHRFAVQQTRDGAIAVLEEGILAVQAGKKKSHGFVRIEPQDQRFFQFEDGTPLPLVGENACWFGARGTYDYDDWFSEFAQAGMNYTRLWMWPHAFGVEVLDGQRVQYNQSQAWKLDYVLDLAAEKGIVVMLCLDYHGIFQVEPDMWGGNNYWPQHPYHARNGGPCTTQNDFFTKPEASQLYRKRLRYLVGRYAACTNLMSWQFFNEISNVYKYLEANQVSRWHDETAHWLRNIDPYKHLITTSFGSAHDGRGMWKLERLDYAQYHLYLNWAGGAKHPAAAISNIAARLYRRYRKPMYVSEYSTDGRGFARENDPYFRGLRQGLWGGLLGGSAGTAMQWWWEQIHAENLYPLYASISRFLDATGFGAAGWHPAKTETPDAGVLVYAMAQGSNALAYLLDPRYEYPQGNVDEAQSLEGASCVLTNFPEGPYAVTWWDVARGRVIEETQAAAKNGELRLAPPVFAVDIAARIRRAAAP